MKKILLCLLLLMMVTLVGCSSGYDYASDEDVNTFIKNNFSDDTISIVSKTDTQIMCYPDESFRPAHRWNAKSNKYDFEFVMQDRWNDGYTLWTNYFDMYLKDYFLKNEDSRFSYRIVNRDNVEYINYIYAEVNDFESEEQFIDIIYNFITDFQNDKVISSRPNYSLDRVVFEDKNGKTKGFEIDVVTTKDYLEEIVKK